MFVTRDTLEEFGACDDSIETFDELFPNGVEVTSKLCVKYADSFPWGWAVEELLSNEGQQEYWRRCSTVASDADPEARELLRRGNELRARRQQIFKEWRRVRDTCEPGVQLVKQDEHRRLLEDVDRRIREIDLKLRRVYARIFGELATRYEARRVRWATTGQYLHRLDGSGAYETVKTSTTAPTPSSDPREEENKES